MQDKAVLKVLLVEGAVNAVLIIVKLITSFITGSAAILGDALHSFSDLANNVIAYFSVKLALQPPDADHQYGHHKFEQLAVFVLATLLVVVAFEIILSALERFGQQAEQSRIGLVLMAVVMIINILLAIWERQWSKKLSSDILHADSAHTFSDVLTTLAVIAGWQLSIITYPWLDSIVAIMVAFMVMYLAYDLFKRSIPILVDQVGADTERMTKSILNIQEVVSVKRVRSRAIGKAVSADVIVTVDGRLSTLLSHEIADRIERMLSERFHINDVTVHIEPAG